MDEGTRIVIAEDHPFFLDGMRRVLEKTEWLTVIGKASDGPTALGQVRSLRPDLAVLDIGLPLMNGFDVVRAIREERIPVEVVFLTIHDDEDMFEAALQLGVKGYLLKDCTDAELLRCISAVSSGQHYTTPSMTSYLVKKTQRIDQFAGQAPGLRLLTAHERAILRLIAQDKTSKEIAREMGIARKTVDSHRSNICRKLEIGGQHVLTRFAARHRQEI
jgi:DNA-binding NarL/FixJ family response regulator